jgi:hypothetical protein
VDWHPFDADPDPDHILCFDAGVKNGDPDLDRQALDADSPAL